MAGQRILFTGFEGFGGQTVNPSLAAVNRLHGQRITTADDVYDIYGAGLPVVFGKCAEQLKALIEEIKPSVVIAVGQAGGRDGITPERVAINLDDARIADNRGNQPIDKPIVPDGPVAYWSTLPLKRMVQAVKTAGIPASVSNSAGTYVCNHLFYHLMHWVSQHGNSVRAGFVHVPYLPEQVPDSTTPSLGLDDIVCALECMARAAIDPSPDIAVSEGREH